MLSCLDELVTVYTEINRKRLNPGWSKKALFGVYLEHPCNGKEVWSRYGLFRENTSGFRSSSSSLQEKKGNWKQMQFFRTVYRLSLFIRLLIKRREKSSSDFLETSDPIVYEPLRNCHAVTSTIF